MQELLLGFLTIEAPELFLSIMMEALSNQTIRMEWRIKIYIQEVIPVILGIKSLL